MPFRDFCISADKEGDKAMEEFSKKLGFSSTVFLGRGAEAAGPLLIYLKSPKDFKDVPRGTESVAVCDTPEAVRLAAESKRFLALIPPWKESHAGMNFISARLARDSGASILFPFSELLRSYGYDRLSVISGMRETAVLAKKYRTPVILASMAQDRWEMRSPSDLTAFGKTLGFDEKGCKKALGHT